MWTLCFQDPPDFWLRNFAILAMQVVCNSCSSYCNKEKVFQSHYVENARKLGVVWYSHLKGAPNQNWKLYEEKLYRMNRGEKKTDRAPTVTSCCTSCSKCWSTSSGKETKEPEWNKVVSFTLLGEGKGNTEKQCWKKPSRVKKAHHQIKTIILRFCTECWGEKEQETTVPCLIGNNHLMQSVCNPSLCVALDFLIPTFQQVTITAGSILRKGAAKKADLSICGYRNIKVAHNVKTCLNGSFLERLSLKKKCPFVFILFLKYENIANCFLMPK